MTCFLRSLKPAAFLLAGLITAFVSGSAPVYAEISQTADRLVEVRVQVYSDQNPEQKEEIVKLAKDLLSVEIGEKPDTDQISRALDLLKGSNRFSKIHMDLETAEDGWVLLVELTPNRRVKSITITGEGAVFKKDIKKAMSLPPGSPFSPADLLEQKRRILKLYENQGFFGTQVQILATEKMGESFSDLLVQVKPGDFYRLGRLNFHNNTAFSDGLVRIKMTTAASALLPGMWGRFVKRDLIEDLKKLKERYWEKGYIEADISYKIEEDRIENLVNVDVQVNPGPLYEADFEGNQFFSDNNLKSDLICFKQGRLGDPKYSRSRLAMEKRYHQAGFSSVRVTIMEQPHPDSESGEPSRRVVVKVKVDEKARTRIASVKITGNLAFGDKQVEDHILASPESLFSKGWYDEKTIKDDVRAIEAAYLKAGFVHARVEPEIHFSPDFSKVDVVFNIREGPVATISRIRFSGLSVLNPEQALKEVGLKIGDPYRAFEVTHGENRLAALVSEKGYPYVVVSSKTDFSSNQKEVFVEFKVDQGHHVKTGSIRIAGNLKTKDEVLKKALAVSSGAPFSLKAVNQTEKNIRDLGLFDYVRITAPGLAAQAKTVDLFVEVREKAPYSLEAGFGYDTHRHLYANTQAKDQNLLGSGKEIWMGGEVSEIGHRAEAGISEPMLFGWPVSATVNLYSEKTEEFNQVFGSQNHGLSLTLERTFPLYGKRRLTTSLVALVERRDQFSADEMDEDDLDEEDFTPRNRAVLTPEIRYDSRDSFIRPTKGLLASGSLDFSKGIGSSLDDFVKPSLDVRWYRAVSPRITMALMGRGGHIFTPEFETDVALDQLFYLGGTGSVRGFNENMLRYDEDGDPKGGLTFASASVEARVDLGKNFELTLFYDTGMIRNPTDSNGDSDPRSSVGAGLRYITPVGPIGLIYGHKLDRNPGEESGRFHFSLGYTF